VNRKLVLGVLSGLAAIALAIGGSTYSAFSDFGQIDSNVVGAGLLKLNIGVGGGANAALDFGQVMPGASTNHLAWVGSDDGGSVPDANRYLTLHNLTDRAAQGIGGRALHRAAPAGVRRRSLAVDRRGVRRARHGWLLSGSTARWAARTQSCRSPP
jgi:predicted ribosomally synthesized peptide with SipW-like signal peptide